MLQDADSNSQRTLARAPTPMHARSSRRSPSSTASAPLLSPSTMSPAAAPSLPTHGPSPPSASTSPRPFPASSAATTSSRPTLRTRLGLPLAALPSRSPLPEPLVLGNKSPRQHFPPLCMSSRSLLRARSVAALAPYTSPPWASRLTVRPACRASVRTGGLVA